MKSRTLTYLVLGALLTVGVTPATVDASAVSTTTAMKAAQSNIEQDGSFQAGPGIAVATTESGKVQGYVDNGIYNYRGIPYAEATERFKPAQSVTPWEGTKMAVQNGPISPQPAGGFLADWGTTRTGFHRR